MSNKQIQSKRLYFWTSTCARRFWPELGDGLILSLMSDGGDLIERVNSDAGDLILFEVSIFSSPMRVSV
jgi:hypothetical protein